MTEIRPLLVSYEDLYGGAARAMYRLHRGLQLEGIHSRILAANKISHDDAVAQPWLYRSHLRRKLLAKLERLPRRVYIYLKARPTPWSTNLLPALGAQVFNRGPHNLINLHWVGTGFVPIAVLGKIRKPVVWTMHDMWPFTGGCHYSESCTGYQARCGACPQLASSHSQDLSRLIWRTKQQQWRGLNFTVVSPSHWLANCARQSSLFHDKRIEVIPNGIDTQIYHPLPKDAVRAQFGLPQDAKLILFGALDSTSDPRKGYHLLLPALHRLAAAFAHEQKPVNLQLLVAGAERSTGAAALPISTHYAGYIQDESKLAALYAAADLFVAPSVEDNLPNTVMEALACGTPSVAFQIGGMPDMIEHQGNGYLAAPFDVDDLAQGMAWVLSDDDRQRALSHRSRAKVMEEFTLSHSAKQYLALYAQLLQEHVRNSRRES